MDHGLCFLRTKGFLGFDSCFRRTNGSGFWLMFSEAQDFWILAHVFRRPRVFWALAHVFRGPGIFFAWAHVFRGTKVLDPSSCFQRPRIFWILEHVFRRPRDFCALTHVFGGQEGSGSWLMFSEA